jgi:hypothetical protein
MLQTAVTANVASASLLVTATAFRAAFVCADHAVALKETAAAHT